MNQKLWERFCAGNDEILDVIFWHNYLDLWLAGRKILTEKRREKLREYCIENRRQFCQSTDRNLWLAGAFQSLEDDQAEPSYLKTFEHTNWYKNILRDGSRDDYEKINNYLWYIKWGLSPLERLTYKIKHEYGMGKKNGVDPILLLVGMLSELNQDDIRESLQQLPDTYESEIAPSFLKRLHQQYKHPTENWNINLHQFSLIHHLCSNVWKNTSRRIYMSVGRWIIGVNRILEELIKKSLTDIQFQQQLIQKFMGIHQPHQQWILFNLRAPYVGTLRQYLKKNKLSQDYLKFEYLFLEERALKQKLRLSENQIKIIRNHFS